MMMIYIGGHDLCDLYDFHDFHDFYDSYDLHDLYLYDLYYSNDLGGRTWDYTRQQKC